METRKLNSPYREIFKTGAPSAATSVRRILYGSNNYHTGTKDDTITPNYLLPDRELKRLTDMKIHFSALACKKAYQSNFIFDKVWASAKALGVYLKLNKLK